MIKYGSLFSGIEAASVAWSGLPWCASWFSEIDPFACQVLAHRWPHVANLGDVNLVPDLLRCGAIEAPDVLVGGSPCQAFSVAGLRAGLSDDRGQLTLKYVEVCNAIDDARPAGGGCIILWENVPGVLSSRDNAFGCFLAGLCGESSPLVSAGGKWPNAGAVYGPQRSVAWRVLDAQYFGVAQRRRRVFVVASSRKDFDPAAVLFEFDGVRRDSAPSREAGEEVAGTLKACASSGGWSNSADHAAAGYMRPVVGALTAKGPSTNGAPEVDAGHIIPFRMTGISQYVDGAVGSTLKAVDHKEPKDLAVHCIHGAQDPIVANDMAHCLGRNSGRENAVMAFSAKDYGADATVDLCPTLRAGNSDTSNQNSGNWMAVQQALQIRRLTPTECERLQGFPDGHTAVTVKGKPAADGPRYKALGNSMAVPVMRWLGHRIHNAIK